MTTYCIPITFSCWCPEHGQDESSADSVRAYDAEHAAELFVEEYERRTVSFPVAGGDEAKVHVRSPAGRTSVFVVTGETVAHYHAKAVEEKKL